MARERVFIAVYMMTNEPNGTIYIGVTSNLYQRVAEHREAARQGFTRKHGLKRLVWFEPFEDMHGAIQKEKSLKRYLRDWKKNLIERDNPHWLDLASDWDAAPVWKHDPK